MSTILKFAVFGGLVAASSAQILFFGRELETKPEYLRRETTSVIEGRSNPAGDESYYVFLQKFPLKGPVELFYHTEVLVCPRSEIAEGVRSKLDETIDGMTDFAEVNEELWGSITASCVELGYGGSSCEEECCSVGKRDMPLNKHQAVIHNADVSRKSLYIYGTGSFGGEAAFHRTCDAKCWSNWAGTDYNPLRNNCNTFTSTVLSCVYGLSQQKPHLGISDTVTVHCKCPASTDITEDISR